ncbi:hypothetical protein DSO57_1024443 [Entomophthora muscae]|uniref:Uncharacterized protein n=1 Tax=Entomophthora muscae TaxID=34485 RepID=A0ACC2UNY4_9FUNG|nr:hypothetical protein DSO57_1024443 [Entomophthora muscae]
MKQFSSFEKQVFNWIVIVIAVVAVLCNGLLFQLALRLQHRTAELKLAVILACVDMTIAILCISSSFFTNQNLNNTDRLQLLCRFKGPVDFLLLYSSFLLVALIAMERFSKVRDSSISLWVWILLSIYTATFTSLVLITAVRSEFYLSPSGIDCNTIPEVSVFSFAVLIGFGGFMFISLLVTLYCYMDILGYVRETSSKARTTHKHVLARAIIICGIYLLLIVPCSILITVEATYKYNALNRISLAITFLVNLNIVANACITLFAHSLIFDQLRQTLPFTVKCNNQ